VTKDRRLGRGLAALLGTPLDGEAAAATALPGEPTSIPGSRPAVSASGGPASGPTSSDGSSPAGSDAVTTGEQALVAPKAAAARSPTGDSSGHPPAGGIEADSNAAKPLQLEVAKIDANPFQPRRDFDQEEITALAESLKAHQQLQPVLVRKVGDRYQLISGERRLRAAVQAGLTTIWADIREADDRTIAELAIVENLQRKDLNAIEKALSFRRYIQSHGGTPEELARRLKLDRSTISNLMRLLELPEPIQDAVQRKLISAGHARALLSLGEERQQLDYCRRIQAEGWSVREIERRVADCLRAEDAAELGGTAGVAASQSASNAKPRTASAHIASLEHRLRLALGTKVDIRLSVRQSGKIILHFASAKEFERLNDLLVANSPVKLETDLPRAA
jgi:ParB family transcriptional regulator, chromosome partitioning protein